MPDTTTSVDIRRWERKRLFISRLQSPGEQRHILSHRSVSHTMIFSDKALGSMSPSPQLRFPPADAKTQSRLPWLPSWAACLPPRLLHPFDGSVVVPLFVRTACLPCVTSPRTAVRFGLPLMSGTPGAQLARKEVEPLSFTHALGPHLHCMLASWSFAQSHVSFMFCPVDGSTLLHCRQRKLCHST